jgi:septal ring factor EnvC (AmiA/AmiB activator)
MAATQHPIEQHEQIMHEMQDKLMDHEERVRKLEEFTTRSDEQLKQLWLALGRIEQMIADMKEDIKDISSKSGKRWESLLGYVISGIVMLIIAYMGRFIFP